MTNRFFPPIRILHPQPLHRFDALTWGMAVDAAGQIGNAIEFDIAKSIFQIHGVDGGGAVIRRFHLYRPLWP
jgi:hypothetical protein